MNKYNKPKTKRTSEDVEKSLQDIYKLEKVVKPLTTWNEVFDEMIRCYHIVHGYKIKSRITGKTN